MDSHQLSEIRSLVSSGKKIQAIKQVRAWYDLGLKDAKELVDAIQVGADLFEINRKLQSTHGPEKRFDSGNQGVKQETDQDLAEVRSLLRSGRKIQAIKLYRDLTGVGLREAKEAVEALE